MKGEYWVMPGSPPRKMGGTGFLAGATPEELVRIMADATFDECPPAAYEPGARLVEMERDNVEAEVIYTTQGSGFFRMTDVTFQAALFRAYNTWLGEFCSYDPTHLFGLALIPLMDVDMAVQELQRSAKLGLRGAQVMTSPPGENGYEDPKYEPFWAAAADLNMPLSFHVNTGHAGESTRTGRFGLKGVQSHYLKAVAVTHEVQRSFLEIIFSGALERHPGLKLVSAENDVSWLPHFLYRSDHFYTIHMFTNPTELTMFPSEYAKRQVYGTFMDDPVALQATGYFGDDNFAWASDYPHTMSTYPYSQKIVDENFDGVSDSTKQAITRTNAIRLYGMSGLS
jgi:predicted TIM-barrel fold metal-dependent hydrolase